MFARNARTFALGALCAVAAAAPAPAQSPFARALPQDTILYVSFPDIRTSLTEMQDTPLAKIWHEPEVQDFFADALKMAHEQWGEAMAQAREAHAQGQLPFDPDDLVKMRIDSASFALTRLSLQMPEGADEPLPHFGMIAHLDFGESAPIWQKVLGTGVQMMIAQAGDEVAVSELEIGGTKLMSLRPTMAPEGFDMGIHMAFVGSGLVIGTLDDDVKGMLTNLASPEGSLTSTAAYKQVASKLDVQGAEAEMFFRPGAMLDFLMDTLKLAEETGKLPPPVQIAGIDRAITALGLRCVEGIGATSSYIDGRCVTGSFVAAPKAGRVGLFADTTGALDQGFLRWIPKDAVSFSAARFDVKSIYAALTSALHAYDENMAGMVLGQLAQLEGQFGISIEKDLFGAFGEEMVSWSMPMAGFGSPPEMAVLLQVNDQDRLLKTLGTLAEMTEDAFSIDKVERRGITVYQVRFDFDLGNQMGGINPLAMFQPTFGFQDGYLVLAFSTGDVKRAFARMSREDDPAGDIRSNEEFAPYLQQIPENVDSITFTDWKATFEGLYQLVTGVLAFVPLDEEIPFDLTLLPDSQTLTQHLFGSVAWSHTTDEGITTRSVSPFGPETMVLLGALVGGGVATFLVIRESEGMGPPIRIR